MKLIKWIFEIEITRKWWIIEILGGAEWWFTYCCSTYCMQLVTLWKSDCRARENLARSIHNSLGFLPGAAFRMVELYLDIVSMRLMHYLPSCLPRFTINRNILPGNGEGARWNPDGNSSNRATFQQLMRIDC